MTTRTGLIVSPVLIEGYVRSRRGIWEHVRSALLDNDMIALFTFLRDQAHPFTGNPQTPPAIWMGSLRTLEDNFPRSSRKVIKRAIDELVNVGFVKVFPAGAQRTAFMVNKLIVTDTKGKRELISCTDQTTDWRFPALLESGAIGTTSKDQGGAIGTTSGAIGTTSGANSPTYTLQVVENRNVAALETLETLDTGAKAKAWERDASQSQKQKPQPFQPKTTRFGGPAAAPGKPAAKNNTVPAREFNALDFAFLRTEDFAGYTPRDLQRLVSGDGTWTPNGVRSYAKQRTVPALATS